MSAPPGFSWTDAQSRNNAAQRDVFGAAMTYTPAGGAPFAVAGVEKRPKEWEPLEPGVVAVRWVVLSDFAARPANGDRVQIGTDNFEVVDVKDDGGGGTYLSLGKTH